MCFDIIFCTGSGRRTPDLKFVKNCQLFHVVRRGKKREKKEERKKKKRRKGGKEERKGGKERRKGGKGKGNKERDNR